METICFLRQSSPEAQKLTPQLVVWVLRYIVASLSCYWISFDDGELFETKGSLWDGFLSAPPPPLEPPKPYSLALLEGMPLVYHAIMDFLE